MSDTRQIDTAIKNISLKTSYQRMSPESVKWFRKYVTKNFSRYSHSQAMGMGEKTIKPKPGFLYTYAYDPKHKDTLPYYDQFPMILCFDITKDGFYGINFHYIPPVIRQAIFIDLLETVNNTAYDEKTKFKITWAKLKQFSKHKYIQHACKRYLTSHLVTPMCKIDPEYWEIAIFLPLAKFQKASIKDVWKAA